MYSCSDRTNNIDFFCIHNTAIGHEDIINSVISIPDPRGDEPGSGWLLASASNDKYVYIWDPMCGKILHKIKAHSSFVLSLAFCSVTQTLISSGLDGSIRFLKLKSIISERVN